MIRPIYLLGNPELRRVTQPVEHIDEQIRTLVADMIETMHHASGIGLAAPQIGRIERIFVVDLSPMADSLQEEGIEIPPQPMVFLNPRITESGDHESDYEEGCLSIPDIHEEVRRPERIVMSYRDMDFVERTEEFDGMLARVIQHEYDHLEGVLFLDHITPLRRRLLKRRLRDITNGVTEADYPVYALGKGELA